MGYIALTAFVLNVVVAVVLTLVLDAAKVGNGTDQTESQDYFADEGDPRVQHDLTEHRGPVGGAVEV
jgi:SSS family solute:Na+ symporter